VEPTARPTRELGRKPLPPAIHCQQGEDDALKQILAPARSGVGLTSTTLTIRRIRIANFSTALTVK